MAEYQGSNVCVVSVHAGFLKTTRASQGLGESAMGVAGGGEGEESSSSLSEEDRKVSDRILFGGFLLICRFSLLKVLKALTESLHLNLAACYLRTEQLDKCIKVVAARKLSILF